MNNGHRPARLSGLLARVEGRVDEVREAAEHVTAAAEGASTAAADFVRFGTIAAGKCLGARCFRAGVEGHCEYHDPANLIEVEVDALSTRRYLRSLAYAEGVTADAAALDHEVPRIAGQILVDRAPIVAADGQSGFLGSLIMLNGARIMNLCTIGVALPPEAAEVYTRAAAAIERTPAGLIGAYLNRIVLDAREIRDIRDGN